MVLSPSSRLQQSVSVMLTRHTLQSYRASNTLPLVQSAALIVSRNNATKAATVAVLADQPPPAVHPPLVRKSRIPITQTFGDLAIRMSMPRFCELFLLTIMSNLAGRNDTS